MKTNTIAVVARTPALGEAIKAHMAAKNPGVKFVVVQKIGDAPAGSEIASRGLPQFVPGVEGVKVHNVGIRMLERDATPEQRRAQWDKIQAPDATVEDILPELGYVEEMLVLPAKAYAEAKQQVTECRLNISEAESDEAVAKAYRDGFNTLKNLFLGIQKATTNTSPGAPEETPAPDEAPL